MSKFTGYFVFFFCLIAIDGYSMWQITTKHNLNAIVWTGDQYVCVGDSGTVLKSPDGYTWIQVPFPASDDLKSIIKLDTMLLIKSGNAGSYFLTNNLLQTFEAKSNVVFNDDSLTFFDQSIFFIDTIRISSQLVDGIARFSPQISQSPVSVLWTPSIEDDTYRNTRLWSITSSPTRIVACGVYGAVVSKGVVRPVPFMISSADGINWDTVQIPELSNMRKVFWTGEQFIACGDLGLAFSEDGIQWQLFTLRTDINSQKCLYGYGKLLNTDSYAVWTINGATVLDSFPARYRLRSHEEFTVKSTAISLSAAVMVGDSGNIALFTDAGREWVKCTTSVTSNLNSICSNGNMFVAVGDQGCIAVSSDGKSWEHNVLLYKDTTLSGFADFDIGLQGNITIAAPCTSNRSVTIAPGTTLKMAPGTHIVFKFLQGKGNKNNPIKFQALDQEQPWGGIKIRSGTVDYCIISGAIGKVFDSQFSTWNGGLLYTVENVSFSHMSVIVSDQQSFPTFYAYDGMFTAHAVNVKGKAVIATNIGASYSFYNSLFQDESSISVYSIQNDFPSRGYFNNCTFGRNCTMSASSNATWSVKIIATNCAFADTTVYGNHQYVGFDSCMYGESLFVDVNARNFNLRPGSAAIDKGIDKNIIHTEDLAGNPRIYGQAVDIGAFEYNPGVAEVFVRKAAGAAVSIMVHGRVLKLSLPASNRNHCSVSINDCSGRLLWKCHIPSSKIRPGNISVALPRLNSGIVLIRVNQGDVNQCKRVLLF